MHVTIRNVHSYTLILRQKSEIVHGTIVVSVGMVPCADIDMSDVFFVWLIWLVFVQKDQIANSCSKFVRMQVSIMLKYIRNLYILISMFSPRFELPAVQDMQPKEGKKVMITCHFCGEGGHKAIYCNKMPPDVREAQVRQDIDNNSHTPHHHMNMHNGPPPPRGPQKPLEEVTCYKCGQKGHYANKCPKGHLAFLSHAGNGSGGQNQNYRR